AERPDMRPVRPAFALPVLAVLAVLATAALLLVLTASRDRPVRKKYGLVFDAGSTHTALYVYQWPADKENGTGIVSQVESCTVNGSGISSYADNPAEAGASLKPCLDKAMTIIPAEQQRETPTYLGATAGMRLLRYGTKAAQVFDEVTKAIREYPVDFRGAQILTGNEEGAFGWITVNYLLETFIKVWGKWTHPPVENVVGALDLGGASTQITFLPGTTTDDNNTRALLRLYGTNYSVYTHSYLCYGQKEVLKRLLASLHQVIASSLVLLCCSQSHGFTELGRQQTLGITTMGLSAVVQAPVRVDTVGPPQQGPPQACPNTRAGMSQDEIGLLVPDGRLCWDSWCLGSQSQGRLAHQPSIPVPVEGLRQPRLTHRGWKDLSLLEERTSWVPGSWE
uniref:Ectonucleoside triphosphate diphosphohydrolase 8 n=1 Tax=Pavo cristatus TaxID=9049 RepID=A0A8C9EK92_PAVCR